MNDYGYNRSVGTLGGALQNAKKANEQLTVSPGMYQLHLRFEDGNRNITCRLGFAAAESEGGAFF
jgi:hypothetical protein